MIDDSRRRAGLTDIAWRAALLACLLATCLGFGLGYLQGLRELIYKPHRERGAEPIDDFADSLDWVEPVPNRPALLRYRSVSFGLIAVALLLVAISQSIPAWHLGSLLLALGGAAIALTLFNRSPIGHIGTLDDRLLLVDHGGQYHLAGGSRVQYRGPFLLIDDIVVFTGNTLLPTFSQTQVDGRVRRIADGGIRVDRKTILVKLLQSRHPLALGACAIAGGLVAAAVLLALH
jgi:hypothetical protein